MKVLNNTVTVLNIVLGILFSKVSDIDFVHCFEVIRLSCLCHKVRLYRSSASVPFIYLSIVWNEVIYVSRLSYVLQYNSIFYRAAVRYQKIHRECSIAESFDYKCTNKNVLVSPGV